MKLQLTIALSLIATALLSPAVGCSVDEIKTEIDCFSYCRQAAECDGDVDRDACEQDCEDTLNDCMADEKEAAQDQLDECSESSCDEFTGCTIEAGAQCFFGI